MLKQNLQVIFITGGTITIIGAIAKLFNIGAAPYIFSTGALIIIVLQLLATLKTDSTDARVRRLSRINLFTSLFLAVAAYFMFNDANSWVIAALIYALSSLIMSFRNK